MEINESLKRTKRKLGQLKDEYDQNWRAHHLEISEYLFPRKGRYLDEEPNKGDKRSSKIYNDEATKAHRTLASGIYGGLTSPSNPWIRLGLDEYDLAHSPQAKEWLEEVTKRMLRVLAKSNFYTTAFGAYRESAAFGVTAALMEEDPKQVIRFYPFTIGEYYLATDQYQRVNTIARVFHMTAENVVERFGIENVSEEVKKASKKNEYEWIKIGHVIEPNTKRDVNKLNSENKTWKSTYYEYDGKDDKSLSISGYDYFPVMTARWDVTGSEVYGRSPGMDALANVKMLQKMEEKKFVALDKMVDPPMSGPTGLKNKKASIVPGDITYLDVNSGMQGFQPTYQISPNFRDIQYSIDAVKLDINRTFYADLFAMWQMEAQTHKQKATATEIMERSSERLHLLGQVTNRIQTEMLDNMLNWLYKVMEEKGLIPEPPRELKGKEFQIEYISILAQAQKMKGTSAIEQYVDFAGRLSQVRPDALDKIDVDETLDAYGDMVGVPAKTMVPSDEANKARQARAQQQADQMRMEQEAHMAESAKTMSETNLEGDNALNATVDGMRG